MNNDFKVKIPPTDRGKTGRKANGDYIDLMYFNIYQKKKCLQKIHKTVITLTNGDCDPTLSDCIFALTPYTNEWTWGIRMDRIRIRLGQCQIGGLRCVYEYGQIFYDETI